MKLLLVAFKILLVHATFLLTVLVFLLALLLVLSTRVLAILSSTGLLLAVLLFLSGNHTNGGIFLLLACLISPYGLPMIAEWLWKRLADLRGILWQFVFG